MSRFRSRAPVSHTCPDIDKAISILEDLRTDNSKLREWGEEEAAMVDKLEKQVEDSESDHAEAVEKLERQIRDMQTDHAVEVDRLKEEIVGLSARIQELESQTA